MPPCPPVQVQVAVAQPPVAEHAKLARHAGADVVLEGAAEVEAVKEDVVGMSCRTEGIGVAGV